jgi:hypothetical protein
MPAKKRLIFLAYCLFAGTFASFLKDKKARKKSQNSRNKGFSNYFCLMMEGSGSGRPKNYLAQNLDFSRGPQLFGPKMALAIARAI